RRGARPRGRDLRDGGRGRPDQLGRTRADPLRHAPRRGPCRRGDGARRFPRGAGRHSRLESPAMGIIKGDRTVEIEASIEAVFAIAADIDHAAEWQGSLKDVEVLERDAEKRAVLVETESDAKVKTVKATLRFSYEPHTAIRWVQEKGETKSLTGWWAFEELDSGLTRATYGLEADP